MIMAIVGLLPPGHYDYVIVPGLRTLTSYLDLRMLSTWWLSERKFPVATKAQLHPLASSTLKYECLSQALFSVMHGLPFICTYSIHKHACVEVSSS